MDSMDNFRERFKALEQQTAQLMHHTRTVERRLRWWRITWSLAAVMALGLVLASPLAVQAITFHCGAGDVQCLIDAINEANANGEKNTIRLEAGTYTLTAVDNGTNGLPVNGLPVITSTLTITGRGAETTIIERAVSAPFFRILTVAATGTLILRKLTLRGGGGAGGSGGGISNDGTLTLRNSALTGNSAGTGAGINNSGTLTLRTTTLSGNVAALGGGGGLANQGGTVTIANTTFIRNGALGAGGGLQNGDGGTVTITNTAFVQNSSQDLGGGLANLGGTVTITNTTIVQNHAFAGGGIDDQGAWTIIINSTISGNSGSPDGFGGILGGALQNTILAGNTWNMPGVGTVPCDGSGTSLGNNLIGDATGCTFPIILQPTDLTGDPGLDTFMDNGRPGNGHFPLLPTSQAIDAGNDAVCPRRDQIGQRRIGPCDIGAIRFLDQDDRQHDEEDDQHDADPATAAQASQ